MNYSQSEARSQLDAGWRVFARYCHDSIILIYFHLKIIYFYWHCSYWSILEYRQVFFLFLKKFTAFDLLHVDVSKNSNSEERVFSKEIAFENEVDHISSKDNPKLWDAYA